LVRYIL